MKRPSQGINSRPAGPRGRLAWQDMERGAMAYQEGEQEMSNSEKVT